MSVPRDVTEGLLRRCGEGAMRASGMSPSEIMSKPLEPDVASLPPGLPLRVVDPEVDAPALGSFLSGPADERGRRRRQPEPLVVGTLDDVLGDGASVP